MKRMDIKKGYYCLVSLCILICAAGCSDDEGDRSPAAEPIIISSDINEDLIMEDVVSDEGSPDYIVDGFLETNADLVIEPGVCIEFTANSGLFINNSGSIQASGTATAPIKFTGVQKVSGFWRGIQVRANDVRNELNHAIVEYAGSDFIATYGTSIKLKGGIAIEGITGFTGSLKINSTIIKDCEGYGLIVEEGTQLREFGNNSFENNDLAAVRIDADNVGSFIGNSSFIGNNDNRIVEIHASGAPHDITEDATWPALVDAVYRVEQSFNVEAELTLEPGVVIEFEANQSIRFKQNLDVPLGIINAVGTETEPITFTGAQKEPGYWQGIIVQSNSVANIMSYCIVEYGGSDPVAAGESGNLGVDQNGAFDAPILEVNNSIFRNGVGCGIVKEGSATLIQTGNTFDDNTVFDGICEF